MRPKFIIAAALAGTCAFAAPGALATQRTPVGNQPFDVPADVCGFPVHVGILDDNEYYVQSQSNADGSTTQRVTGHLVVSLTNESTGKTITENVSGPGTFTVYPDGSGRFEAQGVSFGVASPTARADGVPGIWVSHGAVEGTFDSSFQTTTLSPSDRLTDGCALLG